MPSESARAGLTERSNYVSVCLLVAAVVIYAFWLTTKTFQLVRWPLNPIDHELIFNNMLEHMLRGRFDVDPGIVGSEGFVRDGRVYPDWGIIPALVRLPLLLFPGGLKWVVTCLSSLLAVTLAATMKFNTVRLIFRDVSRPGAALLYWPLLLTVLFGGAQIEFLKASLYQEACLWAGALGACFVFLAIRGVLAGKFSLGSLCAMAAIAGAAMISRATIGTGLCVAIVLLLIVNQTRAGSIADGSLSKRTLSFLRGLGTSPSFLLPTAILLLFGMLTGFVNYERTGNPLVFADYHRYLFYLHHFPDRSVILEQYGVFSFERIPFAVIYYFIPIWVLRRADGQQLFHEHETRLFNSVELPPSSFLLTDALLLVLLAYAIWSLAARRKLPIDGLVAGAIALGLSLSCLLILSFDVLSFRYRIDFHPFVEFGAFIGAALILQSPVLDRISIKGALLGASVIGIVSSNVELILYRASSFGSFADFKPGVVYFYMHALGPVLARFHL
jgi:hypothetical protein